MNYKRLKYIYNYLYISFIFLNLLLNWIDLVHYSPYYEVIFVYELSITLSADFVMLNFELMSLLFLSTAYVQIEMIKCKLSKMGDGEFSYDTLRECIVHHNLILG